MRKSIASIAIALALALAVGTTVASEVPPNQPPPGSSDKAAVCERLKDNGATPKQLAQQNCCPGQGGVCGCQYGQIVCCNGRYSARCRC